jgi:hypothetical protein
VAVSLVKLRVESSQEPEDHRSRPGTRADWLVVSCYLLGAVALTGRLWADPASRAQPGDLPDLDQYTWFVRHSAAALSHGRLPALITMAMNPPHGVNLMWNTSFLLPGVLLTPVTLLAGPQVSLTVALTTGFAGSAASLFLVLRSWGASRSAAALGGALYGFSPALLNAGSGHYNIQFAVLPPLIISALLRILTGRGNAVRWGVWIGLLAAAQLFVAEEMLVDTAIAGIVLAVVLAASRPRAALRQARAIVIGLATGAGVALLICGRALWVQFHGAVIHASGGTAVIGYAGHLTHLYTIPYAFVTPSSALALHTSGSAAAAAPYPQPQAEYLAYLGWPLIVVLIAATILFWRQLAVRITAVTVAVLELLSLGGQAVVFHGIRYPGALLPWYWLQGLPTLGGALPDRLCILADGAAAAALAFSLDQTRSLARTRSWRNGGRIATGIAVLAVLPLIPLPYQATSVAPRPAGWQTAFASLRLAPGARVLVIPVPWGGMTQPMRWQADTGEPGSMIGGDFIAPNEPGRESRAGRAGQTSTTRYLDALWNGSANGVAVPSRSRIRADLALWRPAAVVAVTSRDSRLERFLTGLFGPPALQAGSVIAWRL